MPGGGDAGDERRPVVYCVIPYELAAKLHEPLRRHFAEESTIEVVVERRSRDRRTSADRRGDSDGHARATDRRTIRNAGGRRVGERRARLAETEPVAELPRRARRYLDQLVFVERLEPSTQHLEDLDTARLVTRFQAGEQEVFSNLYERFFDRVYGYLVVVFRSQHDAEDATQQVFTVVFENMDRYERREQPFRAWLFRIVRNYAVAQLKRHSRVELVEPAEIARSQGTWPSEHEDLSVLEWISDRDLLMFVERLPLAQRQVLVLRFSLGFTTAETAAILERNPDDIRALQSRALSFLRQRLTAVGRGPERPAGRPRMRGRRPMAPILRSRRFALLSR